MKLWIATAFENAGKYRYWFGIIALVALFSANKLQAQGGCSQLTPSFINYEPCKYRVKLVTASDCFAPTITVFIDADAFETWSANTAGGWTGQEIAPNMVQLTHANPFMPIDTSFPMIFTLPPGITTLANFNWEYTCFPGESCTIFPGIELISCPDPKDASIIGTKYRECGNLPYSNQPPLAGWTIQAIDALGNIAGEGVTEADGTYGIYDLPYGQYLCREVQQPGWTPKVPASGEYIVNLLASQQVVRNFGNCPEYVPNAVLDGVNYSVVSNAGFLLSGDSILVGQTGGNCFDIHLDLGSTDAFDAWYQYKNQVGSKLDWKVNGTVAGVPNQLVGMGTIEQISDSVQTFQPSIVQASELSVKYYFQGALVSEEVIPNGGKVEYNDLLRTIKWPDIHTDWDPETMTLTIKITFGKGDTAKKQAQSVDLIEVAPIGSAIGLSAINSLDLKACNTSNFGFNRSIKLKANGPTTFCEGGSVAIAATTSATANLQWQKNQTNIAGESSTTYVATSSGNYRVRVKINGNEYFSNETVVTEHSLPSVSASITNDHGNTNIGSIDVSILTGTSPFTFEWKKNGQLLPNNSEDLLNIGSGTYTLLVTDANGCSEIETYVVQNTVGVKNVLVEVLLRIAPNPTSTSFTVTLPTPARPGMRLRITDPAGRLVQELETNAGATQQIVQAEHLPNGLYFLQLTDHNQIIAVEKLVKQ